MKIQVRKSCADFNSYRAARVKSLFNCESGADFSLDAELDFENEDWKIGVIVGASGSGKTSIGQEIWQDVGIYDGTSGWANDRPIIDCIAENGSFNDVANALSAVGLGSVPTWLKPYQVLSNGEKFRAGLARVVAENHERVIIDEFTSVVDRQIAKVGASAFSKAWRRGNGKAILLSCHYDILDWLQPDWVFDTKDCTMQRGVLWQRPSINLQIYKTNGSYWRLFEPHHYLKLQNMVGASYYVGFVDGEPVCHLGMSYLLNIGGMRTSRLVVMPEWQGTGVGMRFLNAVCKMQFTDLNPHHDRVKAVYFNTSHPGLCAALRRDKHWVQVSQLMGGSHRGRCIESIQRTTKIVSKKHGSGSKGYGGHLRAIQGFKMTREAAYV